MEFEDAPFSRQTRLQQADEEERPPQPRFELEKVAPKIKIHNFEIAEEDLVGVVADAGMAKVVYLQIFEFEGCVWIWLGTAPPKLEHLTLAMMTPYDKIPSATCLLGQTSLDGFEQQLARRLALKTKKAFYVSFNLPRNSPDLQSQVERVLVAKLKDLNIM
eukprot:GEZU01008318.1.p1 GENE.GEZU01008318.1~~GEZU01008318.1.p1  ORF type:complete len:161 (-),score=48.34 GEZU01008318.1:94-576(-)